MKKAVYAAIALAALTLGTTACATGSQQTLSGEVTKVIYKPKTALTGATWAAAMRTKSGEIISLSTAGGDEAELAAKVTVGSCIVVSDISSEGGNVGDPSYVKVVSQHGPC